MGTLEETWPDYFVNRYDKKIEGPLGQTIAQKSRNIRRVTGGGVGAKGMVTKGANWCKSWNQIQTLKEYFCCHIYGAQLGPPWAKIVGACSAVSKWESRYLRSPEMRFNDSESCLCLFAF